MQVACLTVGWLSTNCYVVWDSDSREALIVDPGAQAGDILDYVREHDLRVLTIVNTHGHADHMGANREIKMATQAPIMIHAADAHLLENPAANLSQSFGIPVTSPAPDQVLNSQSRLKVGNSVFEVLETPGHSPGSISLAGAGMVFSGDTLFSGSIGRTDIPSGDSRLILNSIQSQLLKLPKETTVYPGHGPATTIKDEINGNPYLVTLVKN